MSDGNEIRELTQAELEEVTGGFLGSLIKKVGRSVKSVAKAPMGVQEAHGEQFQTD
jgi:hypothetical protein